MKGTCRAAHTLGCRSVAPFITQHRESLFCSVAKVGDVHATKVGVDGRDETEEEQ